jgi:hypothetical protein
VWSLTQLEEILQYTAGLVEDDILVVERLAELANTMPAQAVRCLSMMLNGVQGQWRIAGWQESAQKLLATASQSSDTLTAQASQELKNRFVARGYWAYKDP